MQQQLGKMGVVVRSTGEQEALRIPGRGRLSNIGRGAGFGSLVGAKVCVTPLDYVGGPVAYPVVVLTLLCLPVGATAGLIAGAPYGAVVSETWQAADLAFRTVVAELDLKTALPEHLVAFSRSHGYEIAYPITVPPKEPHAKFRYADARKDGIDTVLEIQDLTVTLIVAEFVVNPQRRLILSARVELIRTADGTILDDRVVTDELGPALELNSWAANHATRFRQEVVQASNRMAEQIVTDYFMLYPFYERVTSGSTLEVHLKGLRPLYPGETPGFPSSQGITDEDLRAKYTRGEFRDSVSLPIPYEFRIVAQRINSLEPTMSWEPFYGPNVTYELKIWRAGRLGPEAVVYSRANIEQTSHKLEMTLEPSTPYYWSVRAHFSQNGKDRITEWSKRSVQPSVLMKILSSGIVVLFPDPVQEGFYVFITPRRASQGLQPAAIQSQ
jgi:hypothetical protein